jgi:SprT protein
MTDMETFLSKKTLIKDNIDKALDRFKSKLSKHGLDISDMGTPSITYNLKGVTAGKAYLLDNNIRINKGLLMKEENHKEMVSDTPIHELGHLIVHFLSTTKQFLPYTKPHGYEWKKVMHILESNSAVTHNLTVEKRKISKILYKCDCNEDIHWVTKRTYNSIERGAIYTCKRCKGSLVLSKNAKWVKK